MRLRFRSRRWLQAVGALLMIVTLGCSICAVYLLGMLWQDWRSTLVATALGGCALLALLAAYGVTATVRQMKPGVPVAAIAVGLTVACAIASTGSYVLLLANCSLSCENRIQGEAISPNGRWKAVWFLSQCSAPARFCVPVTHISILAGGEPLRSTEGNAFSVVSPYPVRLAWKADGRLTVSWQSWMRPKRRESKVGEISIEYVPMGWM